MKARKLITHPFTLIISFLVILISGQHLGGFYLMYLLLGLPHAGVHSLLAVGGIMLLLLCYYKYKRTKVYKVERMLNLVGLFMLMGSVFIFFTMMSNDITFKRFTRGFLL